MEKEILEFVNKSVENKEGNKLFFDFGIVNSAEANKIFDILKENFEGYIRTIDESGVRHSIKRHPNLKKEDFLLIPYIVNNYDFIGEGKEANTIVYKKNIDKEYFYVEMIRRNRNKLAIKTFYKRNIRK